MEIYETQTLKKMFFFLIIYGCSGSLLLCPSFSLVAARGGLLLAREHRL